MRVKGNVQPDAVSVDVYEPKPGTAEVRVRENITAYTETDAQTNSTVSGYEYDEYTFHVPFTAGLAASVTANLNAWLETGRVQEVDPAATLYLNAKADAVDEYTAQLIEEGLI